MNETAVPKGEIPPKLYGTGEVLRHAGISRQTLHVYTTLGLVRPREVSKTGRRWYGEEVFPRLKRIAELKKNMTLAQVLELFQAEEDEPT